jgi:hypothetical protein
VDAGSADTPSAILLRAARYAEQALRSASAKQGDLKRRLANATSPSFCFAAATLEVSMLMNIMPILSRRRSVRIRHNIAQDCQEPSVIAEQNNTCVPA